MRRFITLCSCLILVGVTADRATSAEPNCLWTTGDRLLPAWGFYPNGASYGGTSPSGNASAWTSGGGTHTLTWVADFPTEGVWQVWVRQYGGYGEVTVKVDERTIAGGRGGPGGGRYVWRHQGEIKVPAGSHHVDLIVNRGMLDAVLFVGDPDLDPAKAELPDPVENPVLRGLRSFRDDQHLTDAAGTRGFVVGQVTPYAEIRYDWEPRQEHLIDRLTLWGSAGQYIAGTIAVRTLEPLKGLRATLGELIGPLNTRLGPERIDLRVVHLRHRSMTLPATRSYSEQFPDLPTSRRPHRATAKRRSGRVLAAERALGASPAHQSRQFWLTVHVPAGSPPGLYRGNLILSVEEDTGRQIGAARRTRMSCARPPACRGVLLHLLSVATGQPGSAPTTFYAIAIGRSLKIRCDTGSTARHSTAALRRLPMAAEGGDDPRTLFDALAGR